jgi:hypothetical protein
MLFFLLCFCNKKINSYETKKKWNIQFSSNKKYNVAQTGFIKQFDKGILTLEPHWFEALKFYYSPYIQSGMKKEKVMEIILKYYPENDKKT